MSKKVIQQDFFGDDSEVQPTVRDPEAVSKKFSELAEHLMIRIAPDKLVWMPREGDKAPAFVLCRWVEKKTEGGFVPIPLAGRYVRLSKELASELGFRDLDRGRKYETLFRLARAGYIDMIHVSPGVWMIDLDSWFRHVAACAEDPNFWDEDGTERDNYLSRNALGGWKKKV